jgi:hypothetical protein
MEHIFLESAKIHIPEKKFETLSDISLMDYDYICGVLTRAGYIIVGTTGVTVTEKGEKLVEATLGEMK